MNLNDFVPLTERRKADRQVMSLRIVDLAGGYQLAAWHQPEQPGTRETSVDLAGGHGLRMTVRFRGHSPQPDTWLLSWYGVEPGWRLNPAAFDRVNPYHGHKATDVCQGWNQLRNVLGLRFTAIADGSAFIAVTTEESE